MSEFASTTAFELVRRLGAAGPDAPSAYLLVAEDVAAQAVQADIAAELEVQLGVDLRTLAASDVRLDGLESAFAPGPVRTAVLLTMDRWTPRLIDSLDRNIVFVMRAGTVLLLANREIAERALAAAPSLRNRLTDVLEIRPEEESRGASA